MAALGPVERIVIHHSASPTTWGAAEIRDVHVNGRGWSDIGYHWVILSDGTIEAGRPEGDLGAHVAGHNRGSIGVCLVGQFAPEAAHHTGRISAAQYDALIALVGELCDRHSLTESVIVRHRDLGATLCPGDLPLADLRGCVAAWRWLRQGEVS